MGKVQVKIVGVLAKPFGQGFFNVDLKDGATVHDLLIHLGYKEQHVPFIMSAVNGHLKKHDHGLRDNDRVVLSLPVGGG